MPARSSLTRGSLVDLDPDLVALLSQDELTAARLELIVTVCRLPVGPWPLARANASVATGAGVLVLDGMLAREVLLDDVASTELVGPGDVVQPWERRDADPLVRDAVRWSVLAPTRVALLDQRFMASVVRYPHVITVLLERSNDRAQRLALTQAISHLTRVDRRLLMFFWHLAERWGRMTSEGVLVPLTLSHRMLGSLVGARRPTVSTALGRLAHENQLVRRGDGGWLLPGEPVGLPQTRSNPAVAMRRRLLLDATASADAASGTHRVRRGRTPRR